MSIPSDYQIIDPSVLSTIKTPEQAVNYIDDVINTIRALILKCPPPETARIDCAEYVRWERRVLITHGQAMGALQFAQAAGFISIPQFKILKNKIIGATLRRTADVQIGV